MPEVWHDSLPGADDFDELVRGGFSKEKMMAYYSRRPWMVTRRLMEIMRVAWRIRSTWNSKLPQNERGEALRKGIMELGPVFVKIGQTLAQRPDVVGEEAAEELKFLQIQAQPFPDEIAFRFIREDLKHYGPIAPGVCPKGCDPSLPPLFAAISKGPIAAASLGQVYKVVTHDGRVLAIKVQRPNVAKSVALDYTCGFGVTNLWNRVFQTVNDFTVPADEAARAVFLELDYHNEARNMEEFLERHRFLDFVTAPNWVPEFTGPRGTARVLATEWVDGTPFSKLPTATRKKAVRLTAEACLVQLLITGFVHADPHEGNLLFTKEGKVAFLDFGLVDRVSLRVMEGFASGIQSVVAGNWTEVARAMQYVQFTTDPVKRRINPKSARAKYQDCPFEEFVHAFEAEMQQNQAAQARFGDFAVALNRLSKKFLMLTPSYILLITRTFVTLEGIASRADPAFNIYTVALPITLRRVISPTTPAACRRLRDAVLTDDGDIRWKELEDLLTSSGVQVDGMDSNELSSDNSAEAPDPNADDPQAGFQPLQGLLGSRDGRAVRRMMYDMDLRKLLKFLMSRDGKQWRSRTSAMLASKWQQTLRAKRLARVRPKMEVDRPMLTNEDLATQLRLKSQEKRVLRLIFRKQWMRLTAGWTARGIASLFLFAVLVARIAGKAVSLLLVQRFKRSSIGSTQHRSLLTRLWRRVNSSNSSGCPKLDDAAGRRARNGS
eukprot:CAMPEP_0178403242 /NCGR_PEP_ID=MMETSP0689_2-20121128/17265_1 /TAXON_ID=160604 /ORGANISM="Amphidinium massartii, Strain CS-259" /LENGTH=719 /DNA_ID=CAMNT_0020024185 /DNA_START=391 /DNA_END=2547 /DNA_ORIENTATION=-